MIYALFCVVSDCDPPAEDLYDPEESWGGMRSSRHRWSRHGKGKGVHETKWKEERWTETCLTSSDIQ